MGNRPSSTGGRLEHLEQVRILGKIIKCERAWNRHFLVWFMVLLSGPWALIAIASTVFSLPRTKGGSAGADRYSLLATLTFRSSNFHSLLAPAVADEADELKRYSLKRKDDCLSATLARARIQSGANSLLAKVTLTWFTAGASCNGHQSTSVPFLVPATPPLADIRWSNWRTISSLPNYNFHLTSDIKSPLYKTTAIFCRHVPHLCWMNLIWIINRSTALDINSCKWIQKAL